MQLLRKFSPSTQTLIIQKTRVERRNKKQIVIHELYKCRFEMGLVEKDGNIVKAAWKQFKHDYHITNAKMSILLEMASNIFFTK